MQPRSLLPAFLILALLAVGAGCTGDPTTPPTISTVQADAALTAPEALAHFVPPAPAGWRLLAPPSPVSLEEDGVPLVSVTASYLPESSPNGTGSPGADLTIQDTGGRSVGLRRLVDRLAAAPADGAAPARTTLRGEPAYVLDDGPMTGAYIVVADRYIVWLAVTGGGRGDLDTFVAALDIEGLAAQR